MAIYILPRLDWSFEGNHIKIGGASYTTIPVYNSSANMSFARVSITTVCGSELIYNVPYSVFVTGNATTDPALLATLEGLVDAYMASIEE